MENDYFYASFTNQVRLKADVRGKAEKRDGGGGEGSRKRRRRRRVSKGGVRISRGAGRRQRMKRGTIFTQSGGEGLG